LRLADEPHLFVYPVALGAGQRLFADGGPAAKFTLAGSQSYSSGVVYLSYTAAARPR
jgi:dihydrofolate reductase